MNALFVKYDRIGARRTMHVILTTMVLGSKGFGIMIVYPLVYECCYYMVNHDVLYSIIYTIVLSKVFYNL